MRKYSILCPLILLTLWLTACNGSPKFPALTVKALSPRDSLAYVLQYGDSLSRMDTVTLKGEDATLKPDTNLYKQAYVLYPISDSVHYYSLVGGEWMLTQPKDKKPKEVKTLPYASLTDLAHKSTSTTLLSPKSKTCFVFATLSGAVPSRKEREKLAKRYPKDSLSYVYLYLSPRDSLVRSFVKRDSLKGTFITDSLGSVSSLRKELGIERVAKTCLFVIDSTQRILHRQ